MINNISPSFDEARKGGYGSTVGAKMATNGIWIADRNNN